MIVSNLHCPDSIKPVSRDAYVWLLYCAVYHERHTVSYICLHIMISSQYVHLHACCAVLSDRWVAVGLRLGACLHACLDMCCCCSLLCPCSAPAVIIQLTITSSPAPMWIQSESLRERRLRSHKQLEYFSHVYKTIRHSNSCSAAFIFSSYL